MNISRWTQSLRQLVFTFSIPAFLKDFHVNFVVANTVVADGASVIGKNLRNLQAEFDLCPWTTPVWSFNQKFMEYQVPAEDGWRISLLGKLLRQRREMSFCDEYISTITGLIDSLCVS